MPQRNYLVLGLRVRMPRLAYVDGRLCPHAEATTHIEDRGYQFADAVYEVVPILSGRLIDLPPHLERLWRSLSALGIEFHLTRRCLMLLMLDLVYQNRVYEGNIYLQVSRGVGARRHHYNGGDWRAVLVMVTNQLSHGLDRDLPPAVKVITTADLRWLRRDIKSTSLLPNCMAASEAHARGAYEAWQVDSDGFITEGSHSNAWMVAEGNRVITRHADSLILRGITRTALLGLMESHGFLVEERAFSKSEAVRAREAFLTSAGGFVKPIGQIDDVIINSGKAGRLSRLLFSHYRDYCQRDEHVSAFQPLSQQSGLLKRA